MATLSFFFGIVVCVTFRDIGDLLVMQRCLNGADSLRKAAGCQYADGGNEGYRRVEKSVSAEERRDTKADGAGCADGLRRQLPIQKDW